MGWVLRLVETGVDGSSRSVDVMAIDRPGDLGDIAALGLTLAQGKQLVALVQQAIVTAQSRDHAVRRPECRTCTTPCQIKDYRRAQGFADALETVETAHGREHMRGIGPLTPGESGEKIHAVMWLARKS